MKITLRNYTGLMLALFFSTQLFGQTGKESGSRFGKGEDSVRCITNLSLYREYAKGKDFDMASGYWKIVFDECPQASKNMYIDGVKIYRHFLKKVESEQRKNELTDTLMLIYDRRIEYFGQKGSVKGRQGTDLLKYRRKDGVKYIKEGYGYLKECIEIEGVKTSKAVLPTLLSASITLFNEGEVEASQVIQDYLKVTEVIDVMIAKKPTDSRLKSLKDVLNENFVEQGPGKCETLIDYFAKEHETKKDDVGFLKMLTSLLRERECTNSELFFTAAKDLHAKEPSAESAINIAQLARDKGEYAEAISYYNMALELETEEDKKADYYFGIAIANQKLKSYSASRDAALKAAALRPGFGEPYILIGQLYADSKDVCSKISLPSAIYWVAVDMFIKSKTVDPTLADQVNKLISSYSKYYPNKEQAFFLGITEGKSYKIECWINTSTTARF